MGKYSGAHMARYEVQLMKAHIEGKAGINQHMVLPTDPTSRLGFRGKKAKKADLKLIAAKLSDSAKRNPELLKAALNVAAKIEGFKAQEKAKQQAHKTEHKPRTTTMTPEQIEEARKLLRQLEAQEAVKAPQPKPATQVKQAEVKAVKAKEPTTIHEREPTKFNEYELRQKLLNEQKAKMAASLKVNQFGRDVFLTLKNAPG